MFKKVISIFLLINLFISSVGVMAFEHICEKNGTTTSLFFKPESCCAKKSNKICSVEYATHKHDNKGLSFNKKPCCEDKSTFLKVSTEVAQTAMSVLPEVTEVLDFGFDYSFITANFNFGTTENQKLIKSYLYKPPLPDNTDLRVLFQSFLC
jgi:hypothetical protein